MQFHHDGYVSGDPRIQPAQGTGVNRPEDLPDEVDVLIVGSGPAGMLLAAQLSQYPSVTTRIIERRAGRLKVGQADGIQARSVETFQAFGFAERITQEAYRITSTSFWGPRDDDPAQIHRTKRTDDDPNGISEFEHLIVNQARVLDYFAEAALHGPARIEPDFGIEFVSQQRDDHPTHPVLVTIRDSGATREQEDAALAAATGLGAEAARLAVNEATAAPATQASEAPTQQIRAKYVVGCDGARSAVRRSMGRQLLGDQAFHAWGVMDVLTVSDFPDVRMKCAIQSAAGSILLIPREGGHLARFYVDLGEVATDDAGKVRTTDIHDTIARANAILSPYTLEVKDVAWYSVYEVGHRLCDRFDDGVDAAGGEREPRVFIAGDACHTHSAKAGQGMNVSMQDGFNLGWKLGAVLTGQSPDALLATYSAERQVVAQNLIDYDKQWSSLMAKKTAELTDPDEMTRFYVDQAEFLYGFRTQYEPSMITGSATHQALAAGFPIGKRFKSYPVARVADANFVQLGHHHRADGRWRLYAFADASGEALARFAEAAPVVLSRFTPADSDEDAVFDVKVVLQDAWQDVDLGAVPPIFLPRTGSLGLVDYEKVYAAIAPRDCQPAAPKMAVGTDMDADIFDARSVSRDGALVLVRPDMYVAHVLPLDAVGELEEFLTGSVLPG
ncbi:FAD-dependent monooxygenase [Agrococcus jejuensis]|uniref:Phenol 2-monooxygenase n=1 Tax=Agrococcus jejuensis TaxID=399736 RepID=A0A1G8CFC5_9MICO|nr:FAD-dependent monooxygenase [Agrococcus jejuensis]SDH44157.1 phenol 2-monooxygenase [Agrococcus jejuensis]